MNIENKIKIAIHGSCCSREIFNSSLNTFELGAYLFQNPIHTIFENPFPIEIKEEDVLNNSNFMRRMVASEFNKKALQTLANNPADYLMIDVGDLRLGRFNLSFNSGEKIKIFKTDDTQKELQHLKDKLKNFDFNFNSSSEIADSEWDYLIDKYTAEIKKIYPLDKIIINQIAIASQYEKNGKLFDFTAEIGGDTFKNQSLLLKLQSKLEEKLKGCLILDNPSFPIIADSNHKLGLHLLHLKQEVYDYKMRKLQEILMGKKQPKVSIIMPCYNTAPYLRQALDSVVNQTLKDIEIICVNDGSTDNTLDIIKEYAAEDNRIVVIDGPNGGYGKAMNKGLDAATGEYIGILEPDDFIDFEMYEFLYYKITRHDCDFVKENFQQYITSTNENRFACPFNKEDIYDKIIKPVDFEKTFKGNPSIWSSIYKKDFLKTNNIRFNETPGASFQDTSFWIKVLLCAQKALFVKNAHLHYRTDNQNSSVKDKNKIFCIVDEFDEIKRFFGNNLPNNLIEIINSTKIEKYNWNLNRLEEFAQKLFIDKTKNDILDILNKEKYTHKVLYPEPSLDNIKKFYLPKVSVIIPVYNAEKYLSQCLDSVINQTLKDIEIICINDDSTDNSLEILEKYAKIDSRIKIVSQKNSGSAYARNKGLDYSMGEYIGFVDADDYIDINYFEELLAIAQRNASDIAATSECTIFNSNGFITKKFLGLSTGLILTKEEKEKIIVTTGVSWNKIYKKSFLKENNIRCLEINNPTEDNYFTDISIIMANKIPVINNVNYYYRVNEKSQTQKLKSEKDFFMTDVYISIDNFINKLNISIEEKKYWLAVINKRKLFDFNTFKKSLNEDLQKKFIEHFFSIFPYLRNETKKLIISLTSYPARINTVNQTIESLLNQSMKADKVILWLAPEQFPNKENDLPKHLLDLCDKGLIIDWYHDIRSYKKLIPALKKYPDAIIVTADDDLIYNKNWLRLLYNSYLENPNEINCHRAHYIKVDNSNNVMPYTKWNPNIRNVKPSYLNFCTSGAGILYPPHCFNNEIFNEKIFTTLCKNADDIWFWAMCVLNNKKIRVIENNISSLNTIENTQESCLWQTNISDNDRYLANILETYPEIKEKLLNSLSVSSPHLFKDIGLGCNSWSSPKSINEINGVKKYTYDLTDNIYTRYVSWDPIKEGSCNVEIIRLSAIEKRSKRVVDFPINKIVSSGKIIGNKVEFRNQEGCWIGCTIEGAYESFTVEAKIDKI